MDDLPLGSTSDLKLENLEEYKSQRTLSKWTFNPECMNGGPTEEF